MSADPEKAMEVVDDNDHESLDEDDDEGKKGAAGGKDVSSLTAEMLKNPAVMAALQGKLDSMVGTPSGYIEVSLSGLSFLRP